METIEDIEGQLCQSIPVDSIRQAFASDICHKREVALEQVAHRRTGRDAYFCGALIGLTSKYLQGYLGEAYAELNQEDYVIKGERREMNLPVGCGGFLKYVQANAVARVVWTLTKALTLEGGSEILPSLTRLVCSIRQLKRDDWAYRSPFLARQSATMQC